MSCVTVFTALLFITAVPLFSQEDCDVFNIQELSAAYLDFQVDTIILQPDGSYEVQLSNGTTFIQVLGCTDQDYLEYDAAANTEDGSCATLVVNGCTDAAALNYDPAATTDDGSCATLSCANASPTMDGYTYSVVEIGDQCWFAENLRTTVYADDSAIPEVTGNSAWYGLITGARCDYQNDAGNVSTFGRLYNWYAVNNGSGLCPSGWHVPTDGEWTNLENYISSQGFSGTEGTALKATAVWGLGGNGTDDFGFSALPGGARNGSFGLFTNPGDVGYWWSSSPSGGFAWYRNLDLNDPAIYRSSGNPRGGFSVRCLRDAD